MINPTTISEQLLFSTVRLEAQTEGNPVSVGTGFFFDFRVDQEKIIPVILTNKHVVENTSMGRFYLHESELSNNIPKPSGKFFSITMDNFSQRWIPHPTLDLCAMLFQPLRVEAEKQKKQIFNRPLEDSLIPTDASLEALNAVEDVLMVGYPTGLWDSKNNLPLIRRGITATHPAIDFCGQSLSVIDIACFPGSSGSPVLLVNEGMYGTKTGTVVGNRVFLLGTLHAGPQMNAQGEIDIRDIPTTSKAFTNTQVMINLGYVIKAKEIKVLGEIIKKNVLGANP